VSIHLLNFAFFTGTPLFAHFFITFLSFLLKKALEESEKGVKPIHVRGKNEKNSVGAE
jgi:hypothetical protein